MQTLFRWWVMSGILFALVVSVPSITIEAQQVQYASGQQVVPVYEGWEKNADGSFNLVFGYFNRNWEEGINLPVGSDNRFESGIEDQGQPTHFYPRRTRFSFRVRVPENFGNNELVWALTSYGKTERAYATLLPEYFIDKLVISANTGGAGGTGGSSNALHNNESPTLLVDSPEAVTAKVGEPITFVAVAKDDGIPGVRARFPSSPAFSARPAPDSATGLRVSWFVYRGTARQVTFNPVQITEWEDSRDGANSALAPGWKTPPVPEGNRWVVQVTFTAPGTYVLRCQAHDGALPIVKDLTVVVDS